MTLPQNVADALSRVQIMCDDEAERSDIGLTDWPIVRAHLMSQEAEIADLIGKRDFLLRHYNLAESRLAAANERLEAAERDAFKWQLLCADCDDAGEGNRAAINVVNDACRLGSGALERHYGQAARDGLDAAIAATQEGEE